MTTLRTTAGQTARSGDEGTNDFIVTDLDRRNGLLVWFVAEHVVDSAGTRAVSTHQLHLSLGVFLGISRPPPASQSG